MSWTERKTNKCVLEKIGSVLMLRKSMSERMMRLFGHIVRKNGMEKGLMQGKMEGKQRRSRPATTWFQDLKEWTMLDIAGASQLATDREIWRKIIKVTAAQIAPPDQRERERESEREREREIESERESERETARERQRDREREKYIEREIERERGRERERKQCKRCVYTSPVHSD